MIRTVGARRANRNVFVAVVAAVGLLMTGGVAANAVHYDPVPNVDSTLGGTPTSIVVGQSFTQVDAGANHSVGLGSDGHAYTWGNNEYGQLGDGTTTHRSKPVRVADGAVPAGVTFTQVAAGTWHSVGLGSDGNIYTWAQNDSGHLGDGTTTHRSKPVRAANGVRHLRT